MKIIQTGFQEERAVRSEALMQQSEENAGQAVLQQANIRML